MDLDDPVQSYSELPAIALCACSDSSSALAGMMPGLLIGAASCVLDKKHNIIFREAEALPRVQNRVKAGDFVDLLLPDGTWAGSKTTALVKTDAFEAFQMIVLAGRDIAPHEALEKILTAVS